MRLPIKDVVNKTIVGFKNYPSGKGVIFYMDDGSELRMGVDPTFFKNGEHFTLSVNPFLFYTAAPDNSK